MPVPLPSLLRSQPFRVHDALDLGITRRRLQHADLVAPHHGLRNDHDATSVRDRCVEFFPLLSPDAAYSHTTAAALWGLPLPLSSRAGPIHVVSPGPGHTRRPGVVGHRAGEVRGRFASGLPVVEPTVAWAQSASLLSVDEIVIMGDALTGRWSPDGRASELPITQLHGAVAGWGRRRGVVRLRQALELVRSSVWSPKETELRLAIVRAGLPEPPGLNSPIIDADGSVLGHGDLVWPAERLVVEYEGDQHRADRWQWRSDIAKYERYADAGWRVVRATAADIEAPTALVHRIARLLAARALT